MNKSKKDKKQLLIKILAIIFAGLMLFSTIGTLLYYLLMK